MMLSTIVVTIVFVALFANLPSLDAFHTGSGTCVAGQTAGIGVPHYIKGIPPTSLTKVINGTLATGSFTVSVDGVALKAGVATKVAINKAHTLSLKAVGTGKFFRGFNFRLGLATSTALVPLKTDKTVAKVNTFCPFFKAVGITHQSNTTKVLASGTLLVTKATSNVPLEVHVVVQNRAKTSIWYYTKYVLNFA